jgi:hypothetical protein
MGGPRVARGWAGYRQAGNRRVGDRWMIDSDFLVLVPWIVFACGVVALMVTAVVRGQRGRRGRRRRGPPDGHKHPDH